MFRDSSLLAYCAVPHWRCTAPAFCRMLVSSSSRHLSTSVVVILHLRHRQLRTKAVTGSVTHRMIIMVSTAAIHGLAAAQLSWKRLAIMTTFQGTYVLHDQFMVAECAAACRIVLRHCPGKLPIVRRSSALSGFRHHVCGSCRMRSCRGCQRSIHVQSDIGTLWSSECMMQRRGLVWIFQVQDCLQRWSGVRKSAFKVGPEACGKEGQGGRS